MLDPLTYNGARILATVFVVLNTFFVTEGEGRYFQLFKNRWKRINNFAKQKTV